MPVTIDASVFIRAANPSEEGHEACAAMIGALGRRAAAIVLPTFVITEVAGVLARRPLPKPDIEVILERMRQMPRVTFLLLDATMAEEAADIAVSCGMRGPDSIYIAAARQYGATLITADRQQQGRAPHDVEAISPEAAIARLEGR